MTLNDISKELSLELLSNPMILFLFIVGIIGIIVSIFKKK